MSTIEWLESFLTVNGETPRMKVLEVGTGLGLAVRSIERAATRLRVNNRRRVGFPPLTSWRLPEGAS